jgi:protein-tyrosine-phosphatase
MQEEVKKHTKNIYTAIKKPELSFWEKCKEIAIEIFIIIFAVTLSIWLHNLSEHSHQQKEVKEFLTDIKEDLNNDIKNITESQRVLTEDLKSFTFIFSLTKNEIDSLKKVKGSVNYHYPTSTTKTNSGIYEGFKYSGKIGYIENKALKKLLLKYYQEQLPALTESENYSLLSAQKIQDFVYDNAEENFEKVLLMRKFKGQLQTYIQLMNNKSKGYSITIKDAQNIIKQIDKRE